MKLIPAIDLKQGLVVHARGGQRDDYKPVCTEHFNDAAPLILIAAIAELLAPDTVYIADLDAIQGTGDNAATIAQIHERFPALQLWVDSGIQTACALEKTDRITAVIGTETLRDDIALLNDYILSLDFKDGKLLGNDVLARHDDWPATVIALSLDAVGSGGGPDVKALQQLRACYGGKLIAGGGVRSGDDLKALAELGIDGALAASAIYNGTLLT